ncbi:serine/threonine-protein kinase [Montanilutibacter psychrotolerans]|uniref:Serine/threonine protein kinase n=1 Tax=Montanilutibacter psychrotolerans TaxID=1327343 RepID=A0A3M8SR26_9GAMM|nr:serine/threonine-protein kinase [Lysobacter psychrotolerans]RNF83781.1 serine/threonine protein kinase [Lysobacter psychrotolerans]
MDPERWQRLSPLLDELFELDAQARAHRLATLRADDAELTAELERLVALEDDHDDFLAEPLVQPPRGAYTGAEVGPYRLESLLGEGGMGQVWLAVRADGLYQRRVALKLLRPGLADTNLRIRFTREREILARLAHPHIARLLDAGISAEGWPYLALEYVDGAPITDYCHDHETPLETRLRMFQQICDAVSHAHANLIVHRDLKPSNILVTPGGEVRLLDFGIAKLLDGDTPMIEQTRTGMRAFTLHYAAPEQIRGEPVTTMTDVYSLGVVLYELLADRKPYRLKRQTDAEWEEAILSADPLRPSQALLRDAEGDKATLLALRRHARTLSGDLDNIVLKTLSKRPELRYPSVEALALDLQRYEAGRPVQARAQSIGYRVQKYLRRHRWSLATGLMVTVVLSAALAIVAWQAREALNEAARAQAMQDFMIGVFENAGGARGARELDLRELLDASVERGTRELSRQPRARAELLGVVARLRIGLGDYSEARRLLARQTVIIETTAGIPTSLKLESLTQRGRVLRLLGDTTACIELMQPALAEVRREQAQLPPQASEFYSQLGRCRAANGDRQTARQLFERSLTLRQDSRNLRLGEIENRMDLAGLHADAGETRQALAELKAAREQLHSDLGDRHPLLIDIRRNLASLHQAEGALAAAETELRAALEASNELNGPADPSTRAVRVQLVSVLMDGGHYAEAGQRVRDDQQLLPERDDAAQPARAENHRRLGEIAMQLGDETTASSELRRALSIQRRIADPAATIATLSTLARVLHEGGKDSDALPLLLDARRRVSQLHDGGNVRGGDIDRQLGEVHLALGNTDEGMALLEQAIKLNRADYGADDPRSLEAELSLLRVKANGGDSAALVHLDTLAARPGKSIRLQEIAWRARVAAAGLRCIQTTTQPAALASVQALHDRLPEIRPEGGLLSREVDRTLAQCFAASPTPASDQAPVQHAQR